MPEVDLNLMRVFDALIELRSVTLVAERLGLTQSAVSHALGRLRRMLDDPLFVRGPRGLQPSARAEQIAPGVRASLQQMRDALAPPHFDPASAKRGFTIAAGAYFCALIVPPLLERIRVEAPEVSLRIVPLEGDGTTMLDRSLIDLALGAVLDMPGRFVSETLFDEDMVWIAAKAHPLARQPPDLAAILRTPRVGIATMRQFARSQALPGDLAPPPEPPVEWDPAPATHAPATVYDSLTATMIVSRTDMVACVSRRIAQQSAARHDIAILIPARRPEAIDMAMIWHSRHSSDAGLRWLRGLVSQVAQQR